MYLFRKYTTAFNNSELALVCENLRGVLKKFGGDLGILKKPLVHSTVKITPWAFHLRGMFAENEGISPVPPSSASCELYKQDLFHFYNIFKYHQDTNVYNTGCIKLHGLNFVVY